MPYPAQVDKNRIVQTAQTFIEAHGVDALSLAKVAGQLGIKAPSLYRHVKGKDGLLREVNLQTITALIEALMDVPAVEDESPSAQIVRVFVRYRQFAHENPHCYLLALDGNDAYRPNDTLLEQLVLPIQASFATIVGADDALAALRGAFALVHGFVVLELTNQLRRGGDLDKTFDQIITAYISGWAVAN